jgi:Family of unknown function (DUF6528)
MKIELRLLLKLISAILVASSLAPAAAPKELIVCGWDEVFILDISTKPPRKVWSWKAADRPELPEAMKPKFRTTDDCKPVDGGKRILITSSGDGVALVERATGKVVFYGSAGGAHSAEILPGNRVAVAASTSESARNNSLVLFDLAKPDQALFETELVSGHGVVWDDKRQVLWALSGGHLRTYRLQNWSTPRPQLAMAAEYTLPDRGGHDLSPVPNTSLLAVTTGRRVWVFDRDKKTFAPHPQLAPLGGIKCVTVNPATGQTVWTQADQGFWWTATLRFLNPEESVELKGERLYKARWVQAP